jgi:hypothetical protein
MQLSFPVLTAHARVWLACIMCQNIIQAHSVEEAADATSSTAPWCGTPAAGVFGVLDGCWLMPGATAVPLSELVPRL